MGESHTAGNLCQSEQNSMLRASLIATVVALAIVLVVDRLDLGLWFRAAAFVPLYLGSSWLLQALGKT